MTNVTTERTNTAPQVIRAPFELAHNLVRVWGEVGDQQGWFWLDSGAPQMILNAARFPDLAVEAGEERLGVGGTVASGQLGVERARLANLEFAHHPALAMDLGHLEAAVGGPLLGLLGQAELAPFETSLDYAARTLTLRRLGLDGEPLEPDPTRRVVGTAGFEMRRHLPILETQVGGRTLRLALDTGASVNLLDTALLEELRPSCEAFEVACVRGANPDATEMQAAVLRGLRVGALELGPTPTVFSDVSHLVAKLGPGLDGILGYPFLSRWAVAVNYANATLTLFEAGWR